MEKKAFRFLSEESKNRRKLSLKSGETTFIPLELCKQGHNSPRYTKSNDCVKCSSLRSFKRAVEDREKGNKRAKEWYSKNKERKSKYDKEYAKKNQAKLSKKRKAYSEREKEAISRKNKEKHEKKKTDKMYILKRRMSGNIRQSLKNNHKTAKWEELVDYSKHDLLKHLQKTMPKGYGWDDFLSGGLHIDHIVPISAFSITSDSCIDFKRCWAIDNLRLLPAKENLRKANKFDEFQMSLPI